MTFGGATLRLAAAIAVLTAGLATASADAAGSGSPNMLSGDAAKFSSSTGGWVSTAAISVDTSKYRSGPGSLHIQAQLLQKPPLTAGSPVKAARPGHVEPSDVSEAAPTAGLQQTSSISAGRDWNGARLVAPKASRGKGR